MICGTTPTHIFRLPFDTSRCDKVRITYAQCGETVLVKDVGDCSLSGNTVTVKLSQEETLLFKCHRKARVQVRVLSVDGTAFASKIVEVSVEELLDREVL